MNFTKWRHDNILEVIHSNYSKSGNDRGKFIMNDLMTSLNLSKRCNIIRVIDIKLYFFMIQDEIRTSI